MRSLWPCLSWLPQLFCLARAQEEEFPYRSPPPYYPDGVFTIPNTSTVQIFTYGSTMNVSWTTDYRAVNLYLAYAADFSRPWTCTTGSTQTWWTWEVDDHGNNSDTFSFRAVDAYGSQEDQRGGGFYTGQFWIRREFDPASETSSTASIAATSSSSQTRIEMQATSSTSSGSMSSSTNPSLTDASSTIASTTSPQTSVTLASPSASSTSSSADSTAIGAGVGVGAGVAIVIIAVCIFFYMRHRRRRRALETRQGNVMPPYAPASNYMQHVYTGEQKSQWPHPGGELYGSEMAAEAHDGRRSPSELAGDGLNPRSRVVSPSASHRTR